MTLILIGPPAAGKSRIGKKVAKLLGLPFIDTDDRIAAANGPIPEIFAQHGEAFFRTLERASVLEALDNDAVVSLGGGAVLDPETQTALRDRRVVLLTVSETAVAQRIAGTKRPLLAAGGIEAWKGLLEARKPIYEALASATWDTSRAPIDRIATEIADWTRTQ